MDKAHTSPLKKIPPIGMRMVKSAMAVFFCFIIAIIRGGGDTYQTVITTLFCIQDHISNSKEAAFHRIAGTLIGAVYGAIAVFAHAYIFTERNYEGIAGYAFITLMIIPVIYTTMLLKLRSIAYFSCVVFLTIAMGNISEGALMYTFNRVIDTFIGVFVAIAVNAFKLPRKYHNEILFVTGLDDTLLNMRESLSPYSKIELNKMLEEGAKVSVATQRTPASLVEVTNEINLNLPVIAMDGAVLYDIGENQYLRVYVISSKTAGKLLEFFKGHKLNCFTNAIVGDIMLTFCHESMTDIEKQFYRKYKKSPYRHYVKQDFPKEQDAINIMVISTRGKICEVAEQLRECEGAANLKIKVQRSKTFKDYYELNVYNKNATKEHMIEYMKEYIKAEKVVTFGSIEGESDIVICDNDTNEVVKTMKKMYKPLWFKK